MQQPMLVLKNNSKRESGRKVQLSNIKAAKTISDIVSILLTFPTSIRYYKLLHKEVAINMKLQHFHIDLQ